MTSPLLGEHEVKVILLKRGNLPDEYIKPYAGMSVFEAVGSFADSEGIRGIGEPYFVNNEPVSYNSRRKLQSRDTLSVTLVRDLS